MVRKNHIWGKFFSCLKIIVPIVLIAYLFITFDYTNLWNTLSKAKLWVLLFPFLLMNFDVFVDSYKWKYILKRLGHRVKLKSTVIWNYQGNFLNNFFPSTSGGDVYKFFALSDRINSKKHAFLSIFADRVSALMILFLLLLFSIFSFLFLFWDLSLILLQKFKSGLLFVLFFVLLIPLIWFLSKSYSKYHEEFVSGIKKVRKLINLRVLLLSIPFYSIMVVNSYLVSLAYGLNVDFIYFLIFIPIISVIVFTPVSANGVGIREYSTIFLFSLVGLDKEQGFLLAFTTFCLRLLTSLIGGVLLATSEKSVKDAKRLKRAQ